MANLKNLSILGLIFCSGFLFADTCLLENGGFEETCSDGCPLFWKYHNWNVRNGAGLASDEKHSGQYSAKIYRMPETSYKYPNPSWQTPLIPASGKIKISAWLKIKDVQTNAPDKSDWHKAYIAISFFDSEKKKLPGYRALAEQSGTADWRKYEREIGVPAKASFLQLGFGLALCAGTAWLDDVSIVQTDTLSMLQFPEPPPMNSKPKIFPSPKNIVYGEQLIKADGLRIFIPPDMPQIKRLLPDIIPFEYGIAAAENDSDIILGLAGKPEFVSLCNSYGIESLPVDCDDEEYLLEFKTAGKPPIIAIMAKNEKGIFYALQSIRQLLVKKDGISYLQEAQIHDKPCFKIRGYIHGGFHGWRGFNSQGISYIKKFGELKYNYSLTEISRSIKWDISQFDDNCIKRNKDYIDGCNKYFITPVAEISPGWEKEIPCWSDDKFVDKWFGFIEKLYNVGYRDFCFGFDDFQNIGRNKLLTEKDKGFFKNLGEAQCHFLTRIYNKIRSKYGKNMKIFVIYHYYSGCTGEISKEISDYMEAMKKLPDDVLIFWTGSEDRIDEKGAAAYLNLSGKKRLAIFDNWYAESERTPELLAFPPINDRSNGLYKLTEAYFLNVPIFDRELIGTAPIVGAEYLWNTEKYDPAGIAPWIIERAAGMNTYCEIYKIGTLLRDAAGSIDDKKRQQYINSIKTEKNASKQLLPAPLYGMLAKEMDRIMENLESIQNSNTKK